MKFENKVIYQIYPKSFLDTTGNGIGDINGIISKLDYLEELGIDYIWLSPCVKSPQKDNGYDISNYYEIDSLFGNNEDYYRLINEAKKKNIKIMMDLVLNHTSTEHEWFKAAISGDKKYLDYYIWTDEPNDLTSFFEGSAWEYSKEVGKYYFHLFDKTQADLNWSNQNVRKEVEDIVNFWISKGVEGFRLDVIDLIGKEPFKNIISKGPNFYKYLEELSNNTFSNKLLTVGECWGSTILESEKMCNDKGLTQAFNFESLTVDNKESKWNKKKLDLKELSKSVLKWQNDYKGIDTLVIGNHDLPRLISVWLDDDLYRVESAKLLINLLSILKGNLYIYQGEEIGMRNSHCLDISKYKDVETLNIYDTFKTKGLSDDEIMKKISLISRDNARVPFAWNSEEHGGFTTSNPWLNLNDDYKLINLESDLKEHGIFEYYKKIIKFRKNNYDLIDLAISSSVQENVLIIENDKMSVISNFSNFDQEILFDKGKLLFSNYENELNYFRPFESRIYIKGKK